MISINIPQPDEWLNSNHRNHWAIDARRKKAWRTAARYAAHNTTRHERVHIECWIHKKTRRTYDAHNLTPTAKAVIDGLVDAGLIPDDTNQHLIGPDMRQGETRPKQPGITLTITPQEASHA